MTHASLFSGIGAAELAAVWMGWTNLFHCEVDGFCNKILDYWFNDSIAYGDIRKTDFRPWRGKVDVLSGGFPCQPFSFAGRRKGTEDDRYLFPEMLRAVSEIRPTWVVGENVAGLITMVHPGSEAKVAAEGDMFGESHLYRKNQHYVLYDIIRSLECVEYEVQPFVIPACAVGAPHRRDRIWIVAHRTDTRSENQQKRTVVADTVGTTPHADCSGRGERHNSLQSDISDGMSGSESNGIEWNASHTDCDRQGNGACKPLFWKECKGPADIGPSCKGDYPQERWRDFPTVSPVCSRHDGLPFDVDRLTVPYPGWRAQSVKAYGNSMVPQVMFEIFSAIADVSG